jgi:hypothetical protein
MLIDSHVHVTQTGKWFETNHDASVVSLMSEMDRNGVDQAVLLPISGIIPNEFVASTCLLHPKRFIGAVSVDPNAGLRAISELRDYLSCKNMKLLKLHPSLQNFNPLSREVVKLLEVCAELEAPALFDCFPFDRKGPIALSAPLVFDELAKMVPSVKMILAHAGGHRVLDACMVAKSNPNILLDISYSPVYFEGSNITRDFVFAIKKVGAQRVLYGSDFPEVRLDKALAAARRLVMELPAADQDLIFAGSIRQLLRIDKECS